MVTTNAPNPRASLLAGLRTGGVRSASGPGANIPQTAAPGGSFNIPHYMPAHEEEDELSDMMAQNMYINNQSSRFQQPPMTAAVDGGMNRFAQQQTLGGINYNQTAAQNLQNLQLQMMQLELQRLQAIQAQQFQAELLAQAQAQAQMQARHRPQPMRRATSGFAPSASAGPTQMSFDVRAAAANAQMRKMGQVDHRAQLGMTFEDQVPMTAALGGRFGSRAGPGRYDDDDDEFSSRPPASSNHTTVISGGTSLGTPMTSSFNTPTPTQSKSDAAVSWRRGGANNSVLSGNRAVTSPTVKITPPPAESNSPPLGAPVRGRPSPLTLNPASLPFSPNVAIDIFEGKDGDESSSVSSKSDSSPSTPQTASSSSEMLPPPLSPREQATKKLYEGLGIGRPAPNTISIAVPQQEAPVVVQRFASHPVRQPRGPPSNNDELLPKNFASRSRRQAISALLGAAERREIEAY